MKKLQKKAASTVNTVEANGIVICICGCATSSSSKSFSEKVYAY